MAVRSDITQADEWFQGEDKILAYHVKKGDGTDEVITGWAISWKLTVGQASEIASIPEKAVGSGITLATPIANVAIASADTALLPAATYWYVLWRTNAGVQTVLAYGSAQLGDQPQP